MYPQMSVHQKRYVSFVTGHPGCTIADIVRACKVNRVAGHAVVYDGVHRLAQQGILRVEHTSAGRTKVFLAKE